MKVRGQDPKAWLARWQQGTCPVHGRGLSAPDGAEQVPPDESFVVVCSHEDCALRARQWPGKDGNHSLFGWEQGPEEIRAALAKAGVIHEDNAKPGRNARNIRTTWPLGEGDFL